jgi:hypothetical protein
MAFVVVPRSVAKFTILGVLLLLAFVFLLIGALLSPDRRWLRETGIVIFSASCFGAFTALTMACMFLEPEFQKMVRPEQIAFFGDYVTGILWIALLGALGGLGVYSGREKPTASK